MLGSIRLVMECKKLLRGTWQQHSMQSDAGARGAGGMPAAQAGGGIHGTGGVWGEGGRCDAAHKLERVMQRTTENPLHLGYPCGRYAQPHNSRSLHTLDCRACAASCSIGSSRNTCYELGNSPPHPDQCTALAHHAAAPSPLPPVCGPSATQLPLAQRQTRADANLACRSE